MRRPNLINSGTIFFSTLIVATTLILVIYLTGLEHHRSLYMNSLLSATILSVIFLTFITIGLYKGWKQKDTLGNLLDKIQGWKRPGLGSLTDSFSFDIPPDYGEAGCFGVVIWFVLAVFGAIIFWAVGAVVWGTILLLAGILYPAIVEKCKYQS